MARRPLSARAAQLAGARQVENGIGSFYAEYDQNGKKMIGRLQWSNITASSTRFAQAGGDDGGKTWETNWIMEFRRA